MRIVPLAMLLVASVTMAVASDSTSKVSLVAVIASDFSLEANDFATLIADEPSYKRSQVPAKRLAEAAGRFRKELFELSSDELTIDGERCQLLRASIDRLSHRYGLVKNSFASDQKLWRKERLAWANESLATSYKRLETIARAFVNSGCQ